MHVISSHHSFSLIHWLVHQSQWRGDFDEKTGGSLLAISVAFGFSISSLAYAIGHISGGKLIAP